FHVTNYLVTSPKTLHNKYLST
ncbi:unnamed protein product, partial [Tuber melanosporum]